VGLTSKRKKGFFKKSRRTLDQLLGFERFGQKTETRYPKDRCSQNHVLTFMLHGGTREGGSKSKRESRDEGRSDSLYVENHGRHLKQTGGGNLTDQEKERYESLSCSGFSGV